VGGLALNGKMHGFDLFFSFPSLISRGNFGLGFKTF
jgi:hypothetical protein